MLKRTPDDPHAVLRALMRADFGAFMRKCFPTICGGDLIAWNWHLDAIVHALNQVHEGSSRRLLVTMPPRNLKSIAISVAWVAWMLGQDPRRNFIVVTYADNLTGKHARDCLAIMQSAWYRELFPRTIISAKRSASGDFETTQGGGRLATTVTGTLTGRGGDFIIIDDPIKPEEAYSATTRDFVNQWYQSTLASRLNDKASGAIICVMQRLHQHDLAGMLLEAGGWDALSLPAIATLDEIIMLPRGRVHHRRENDVLHPERESRAVLDDQKKTMGSYAFEAQYQQDPISPKGGIIQFEWLKSYPPTFVPARPGQIVASWDTASKDGLNNDYSVCVIGHVRGREVRVLEVFRERLIFPELKRHVVRLALEYKVDVLLVEDAASGQQLIQTLKSEQPRGVPLPIARRPELDKTSRMYGVSGQIEAGALMLPEDASWLAEFVRRIIGFPGCRYNDQADALTQLMNWVLQSYNANNVSMPEGPISGYLDEHGNVRWSDGSSSAPTDPDFDPWSGLD